MYRKVRFNKSRTIVNTATEGEPIERKIERMIFNKEPIKGDGAPMIYQERSKGVEAGYNIRTDRFDVAIDAMTVVHKTLNAKRDSKIGENGEKKTGEKDSGAEPTQGTNN